MRLSKFIVDNLDAILQQWEDFARSLPRGPAMSIEALRDDAERMLRFVAADIETDQSRKQELAKATGHGPALPKGESSAAHDHGLSRAVERFSLVELVSEYRAIRASVTRMWMEAAPPTLESIAQFIRFNEAIDQILAEGVLTFTERFDQEADLFFASVGHDLSNPVNAVKVTAQSLAQSPNLSSSEQEMVARIGRATDRLSGMLIDLRDFTRARLGGLVKLERENCDVDAVVRNVVDEVRAIYPTAEIAIDSNVRVVACLDAKRTAQLISNLVANAAQHGSSGGRITVSTHCDDEKLTIGVHNTGTTIDAARITTLFDPAHRGPSYGDEARLGLGLYIARQIALAHGGDIGVESSDEIGTLFTVRLPLGQRT
jgi:signal transduction histidine kinase